MNDGQIMKEAGKKLKEKIELLNNIQKEKQKLETKIATLQEENDKFVKEKKARELVINVLEKKGFANPDNRENTILKLVNSEDDIEKISNVAKTFMEKIANEGELIKDDNKISKSAKEQFMETLNS